MALQISLIENVEACTCLPKMHVYMYICACLVDIQVCSGLSQRTGQIEQAMLLGLGPGSGLYQIFISGYGPADKTVVSMLTNIRCLGLKKNGKKETRNQSFG